MTAAAPPLQAVAWRTDEPPANRTVWLYGTHVYPGDTSPTEYFDVGAWVPEDDVWITSEGRHVREWFSHWAEQRAPGTAGDETVDEIVRGLRAEVDRLRTALAPFALLAEIAKFVGGKHLTIGGPDIVKALHEILDGPIGNAARDALEPRDEKDDERT